MPLRVAELETLFTANVDAIAKAETDLKAVGKRVESKPITQKVTADEKGALAGMDRVEQSAKRIVSAKTIATVDANIDRAEKSFVRVYERLDYLRSVETELDVKADISRAEAQLSRVQRSLDGLRSARAVMEVDADTEPAEDALADVQKSAGESGEDAGEEFGDKILAALLTIPIAGAVIGIGAAAAKGLIDAFEAGLLVEVGYDRLAALTGLDEADAMRIGRAAGEAYANTFGESIEQNMDTARLALQFRLLDPDSTTRDAEKVVEGLAGISAVLGEDVRPVAAAVTTLLRSGVVKSADQAFDLLAAGAREGVNRNEDLLDTLTEYPALFARLGLSGEEALGLINQGMQAGARNSDLAADALKEFQIRATDGSKLSAQGFQMLGLNAQEMTDKIAHGGKAARDGLDLVLDRLRVIEDPVKRNAAAVALFGTQAEDLGTALFHMDLSNAVKQLDGVRGAAQKMFDTLSDNDASRVERAKRNIDVAVQGIQGSLAAAFSEPLGDFADWVSENRGPLLQFFLDMANGAIDFAESAADATGEFVSGPLAELVSGLAVAIKFFNWGADTSELDQLAESMRNFDETTDSAKQGLEEIRGRLNDFAEPVVQLGHLNDASLRLAGAIDEVGTSADGSKLKLGKLDYANLQASDSGKILEGQVRAAIAALSDQITAAADAGEGQDELTARYGEGTKALADQLVQTGLTRDEARKLIDTILETPESVSTRFDSNVLAEKSRVQGLADRITTLPNGKVVVSVDTSQAYRKLMDLQTQLRQVTGQKGLHIATGPGGQGGLTFASGGLVEFMAAGGLPGLTPMASLAQLVPPNTYRVVGDRGDVPELYAPLDGSARSWALIAQGINAMLGGASPPSPRQAPGSQVTVAVSGPFYSYDPADVGREMREQLTKALDALPLR